MTLPSHRHSGTAARRCPPDQAQGAEGAGLAESGLDAELEQRRRASLAGGRRSLHLEAVVASRQLGAAGDALAGFVGFAPVFAVTDQAVAEADAARLAGSASHPVAVDQRVEHGEVEPGRHAEVGAKRMGVTLANLEDAGLGADQHSRRPSRAGNTERTRGSLKPCASPSCRTCSPSSWNRPPWVASQTRSWALRTMPLICSAASASKRLGAWISRLRARQARSACRTRPAPLRRAANRRSVGQGDDPTSCSRRSFPVPTHRQPRVSWASAGVLIRGKPSSLLRLFC